MRVRLVLTACLLGAASAVAAAQPAPIVDDRPATPGAIEAGAVLVAEGTALGGQNRYEQALTRFLVAADRHPSATHDCLVALAYARIGRLTPARLWLDAAARRGDVRPPWCASTLVDDVTAQLATRGFVAIEVVVTPADAEVWIGDDVHVRGGRTIWLPPGEVAVRAQRTGHQPVERRDPVVAGARLVLDLPAIVATPDRPVRAAPPPSASRSRLPWLVAGAGGAALIAGGVFHALAAGTRADANAESPASGSFATLDARFVQQRAVALSLYGAGAVGVGVGLWLATRSGDEPQRGAGLTVGRGGGAVTWSGTW